MTAAIILGTAVLIAALGLWALTSKRFATPPVKTHDAIDDEIRRERIELHNTSRDYAELQLRNGIESYPKSFVDAMLSAAFRSGAKWQQQRPH